MYAKITESRASVLLRGLVPLFMMVSITFTAPASVLATPQGIEQDPEEVYQQALNLNLEGEWEKALTLFRQLADRDTPRAAEASFYSGLCLENLTGRDVEAFQEYARLRSRYPESPMAVKALSHQITLAGVLGEEDEFYREFLARQLESDEIAIHREAALSLSRLGDERATSGLLEILRNGTTDQKLIALERIQNFDIAVAEQLAADAVQITASTDIQTQAEIIGKGLESLREERERTELMLTTDRKFLMERIKRKGDTWTDEELLTQGLYHVMPSEMFARYLQANSAEKQNIYEEFFENMVDPSSVFSREEIEIEFRRRVAHAAKIFSEPYKAARSLFGASDWLTADNPFAPWDARGELYIRYGEPDNIFLLGFNTEEWLYTRLRVDFTVRKYMVNFYRNAIFPGRASQQDYFPGHVQANYIDLPRFEYWPKR